jgi:L-2-hydroxycarboxylate dehydrogenase (NAD+)
MWHTNFFEMHNLSFHSLTDFVQQVFISMGFHELEAGVAAHNLCLADLKGIDSHGIARLSGFVRLIKAGRINPQPHLRLVSKRLSAANIDADGAIGLWSGRAAMDIAMEMAENTGNAIVGVHHSNHFGIATAHVEYAAQKGYIAWAMTNASPLVAPLGCEQKLFGTNPIAWAVPNPYHMNGKPFILDMATSAVANGKLELAAKQNKNVPYGWVIDRDGNPSNNPQILKEGGALLPLGSDEDHGVHKGYGLNAIVDILTGVLTGANFGPWVPPFVSFIEPQDHPPGKGIGHVFGVINIDAFMEKNTFYSRMALWSNTIKQAKTSKGTPSLLIHGEPEYIIEKERLEKGIPIQEQMMKELQALSTEFHIPLHI